MREDIYQNLEKNPAVRLFVWLSPLGFLGFSVQYYYIGLAAGIYACVITSFLSIAAILMLKKNVSITFIINFLLALLILTVGVNAYLLGPYGISKLPWALLPLVVTSVHTSIKTRVVWTTISLASFSFGIIYGNQLLSNVKIDMQLMFVLSLISLTGVVFVSSLMISITTKFWLKTKINLAESEANGRILLRTVVHDISNSLTLIKTAHSILELSSKSEEGTPDKALGSILTGLNKASNLVTQIKEIEALQSGKIELHLSEQSLMELVKESAESLSHILKRKNLSLSIVENQKDLRVITNPVSFRISIIENILTNAIKFSPVGSTIEIRLFETINKVGVSIKDHGEGIPKHLIDKLFDKNSKTTRAGSLGEIGTGFGMLIIEAYCDLLGYDLRVRSTTTEESSTKKGTTITILVPKSEIDSNTIAS